MAETQGSFHGAVSFPHVEDARQFRTLLNSFMDSSSKVFFEIEKNPMYHLELIGHAKALLSCCENFELNAIAFSFAESQGRCKRAFEELTNHVTELEKVLLEKRPSVQRWSLAQADRIALCVKGVLGCVKNLIDFNENDVIVVVAQNIELCRKATDALEHAKSHIPKHKSNLTNVTDALKDQVANRATVIKDARTIEALNTVRRKLDPVVEDVLNRGTSTDYANLRNLLNEAAALFVPQFSEGDFSYRDVDSGAFNSAIDDLLNSIQRGDGAGIRDNAGRLGAQARALNDAGAALKEQTKSLVAAAADALKNRESEEAQQRLKGLMDAAKRQAEELAAQQARENQRRQQLLKASAGLGVAIDHMQGNLASYRDAVKHSSISNSLERDMEREEQERLSKLGK